MDGIFIGMEKAAMKNHIDAFMVVLANKTTETDIKKYSVWKV